MYREPERAVEAPVPVLAPVPTPVSAEAAAPQIGVKLPAQDQGSADLGRTPDGRGEPAPRDSGDEKMPEQVGVPNFCFKVSTC